MEWKFLRTGLTLRYKILFEFLMSGVLLSADLLKWDSLSEKTKETLLFMDILLLWILGSVY